MKKTTKKNVKKTTFVPAYIVNLVDVTTVEDTLSAFAIAKMAVTCTKQQYSALIEKIIDTACDIAIESVFDSFQTNAIKIDITDGTKVEIDQSGVNVKKPNVFKRFWNWITRKNK